MRLPKRRSRHERRTPANLGRHRADQGRAVLAPRLHDRLRRRDGRLHACGRARARRRDQDRHQRPHRRRCQDQGRRRRDARLFRAAGRRQQSAGRAGGDGDFRPARIHQGRDAASRQARRVRGRAGLLFPQGRRPDQDHRNPAAVADRECETGCRTVVRSRHHGGLGEIAGRRHRRGSASSASAAAAARSGNMPPTAAPSRRASRSTGRRSTRRTRSGRRARPSSRPK